jgi:hypothetical protein
MEPREVLAADQIDLSDIAFWERPLDEREGAFALLRRERHWPSSKSLPFCPNWPSSCRRVRATAP